MREEVGTRTPIRLEVRAGGMERLSFILEKVPLVRRRV